MSGNIKEQGTYYNGLLYGQVDEFNENGDIILSEYYINNKKNGLSIEFYPKSFNIPNSVKKSEVLYRDGFPVGKKIIYNINGDIISTIDYSKEKVEQIIYYSYKENKIKRRNYLIDNELNGISKLYYNNPQNSLKAEYSYKNSMLDGESIEFYENGNIKQISNYKNNLKNGIETYFYPNKNKKYEITYENGQANGPFKYYYENGNIQLEGSYKNRRLDGKIISYYENGNIQSIEFYNEDKKINTHYFYNKNNELEYTLDYSNTKGNK